jgi:hypothetical protein
MHSEIGDKITLQPRQKKIKFVKEWIVITIIKRKK